MNIPSNTSSKSGSRRGHETPPSRRSNDEPIEYEATHEPAVRSPALTRPGPPEGGTPNQPSVAGARTSGRFPVHHRRGCRTRKTIWTLKRRERRAPALTDLLIKRLAAARTAWLVLCAALLCAAPLARAEYNNVMPDAEDELFSSIGGNLPASGVSTWAVSEPYVNLWIFTQPLTYYTAYQKPVGFALAWKHRNTRDANFSFGFGPGWECSWLSYYQSSWGVYAPMGGRRSYAGGKDLPTTTTFQYDSSCGCYLLRKADGSVEIFRLPYDGTNFLSGNGFYYLHQRIDLQLRTNYFYYDTTSVSGTNVVRLKRMVDSDNKTTTLTYGTGSLEGRITQVTDPYSRSVTFGYDSSARLTSITNAIGLVDRFYYDSQDFITHLVTPYGTNVFVATTNHFGGSGENPVMGGTNQVNRSLEVTNPDSTKELFLYRDMSTKLNPSSSVDLISSSSPTNEVPNTLGLSNTFDNSYLDARNTFHWNALQYAQLSSGYKSSPANFSNLTTNDYKLASLKHWLRYDSGGTTFVKPVASVIRAGSPDGGTLGQKTWLDYAAKSSSYLIGTNFAPSFVALVLPDGTTRFSYSERTNAWEKPTRVISTYSISSGSSVATRTNSFTYSSDGFDVLTATGYLNELVSSNAFNNYHQTTLSYNALNERTDFTYHYNFQVKIIQRPSGCATTNEYNSGGPYRLKPPAITTAPPARCCGKPPSAATTTSCICTPTNSASASRPPSTRSAAPR